MWLPIVMLVLMVLGGIFLPLFLEPLESNDPDVF